MRNRVWFTPYKMGSKSCTELAKAIGGRQIKLEGSKYVQRANDLVVNWGSSAFRPVGRGARLLNSVDAVRVATSKLQTFGSLRMAGLAIPEYTTDLQVARSWQMERFKVVARNSDNGKGGQGIRVYQPGEVINDNHLFYTRYFRKGREFRLHIFGDQVIFEQEKKKRQTAENIQADPYIRSHDRGWVFCHNHFGDNPTPVDCRTLAIQGVKTLGLDFGAVDIGWNQKDGPCIFEINTAPGIEGATVEAYKNAIQALL